MKIHKIKSNAKINLSLGVLGKLKSKLHKIESLISFIDLCDEILIKEINSKNHKVEFRGKFSKKIKKKNTISNLLKLLDNKNKLKNKKYFISVNKKIPIESGMGGGSMNAASILKFFLEKKKLNLNHKEILQITSKIGSDVIIGLQKKKLIIYKNNKISEIKKKLNLYTLLVKPNFGCSTKKIYKNTKIFSKPLFNGKQRMLINNQFLKKLKNDLEQSAFSKYPILKRIKEFMETIENVLFVRMTGSGSTIIGYFILKKQALNARKILKKKYKHHWCILSRTI